MPTQTPSPGVPAPTPASTPTSGTPSRWRRFLKWVAPKMVPILKAYIEAYLKKQAEKAQGRVR